MAKVKLTQEQVELLKMGSKISVHKPEEKEYFYVPYWFEHDVKTDTWTLYMPDKLPEAVKLTIHKLRNEKKDDRKDLRIN